MAESVTGLRFISSLLSADATLMGLVSQVYADSGPLDAVYPFVTVSLQDGEDEIGLGGEFIVTGLTYTVKVVGQGASYLPLETAANRIRTLLHRATGAAGNGEVFECLHVAPVQYREYGADGKTYSHLGGLYDLIVRG